MSQLNGRSICSHAVFKVEVVAVRDLALFQSAAARVIHAQAAAVQH